MSDDLRAMRRVLRRSNQHPDAPNVWITRWWQLKYFWNFHPHLGKITILTDIFQMGWFNHQLDYLPTLDLNKMATVKGEM